MFPVSFMCSLEGCRGGLSHLRYIELMYIELIKGLAELQWTDAEGDAGLKARIVWPEPKLHQNVLRELMTNRVRSQNPHQD